MSNPIFNALGGASGDNAANVIQQFQKFMTEMKGKDPNEELKKLLQSGQVSQQQLNQAQQMAYQMRNMFAGLFK